MGKYSYIFKYFVINYFMGSTVNLLKRTREVISLLLCFLLGWLASYAFTRRISSDRSEEQHQSALTDATVCRPGPPSLAVPVRAEGRTRRTPPVRYNVQLGYCRPGPPCQPYRYVNGGCRRQDPAGTVQLAMGWGCCRPGPPRDLRSQLSSRGRISE